MTELSRLEKAEIIRDFDVAVRQEMKKAACDRVQAVQRIAKRNPQSHRSFLEATNKNYRDAQG